MPAYCSYVEREMGAVVNLIKVLQSKPEQLVDTYLLLMPASAQSLNDFARLCELKVGGCGQHMVLKHRWRSRWKPLAALSHGSRRRFSIPHAICTLDVKGSSVGHAVTLAVVHACAHHGQSAGLTYAVRLTGSRRR